MKAPYIFHRLGKWIGASIQRRLVIWSIGFWIVFVSVLSLTFLQIGQANMMEQMRQRNIQLASVIARDINAEVSGILSDARLFTRHLESIDPSLNSQANAILSLRLSSPERYQAIYYYNDQGNLLLHLTEKLENLLVLTNANDIVNRPPITVAEEVRNAYLNVKDATTYMSDVHFVGIERVPTMYLGMPTKFIAEGTRVLVLEMDLTDIYQRVYMTTIGQTGLTYAVSRQGTIIAHPVPEFIGRRIHSQIEPLLEGYVGFAQFREPSENRDILAAYSPVGGTTGWGIVVQQDEEEGHALINRTGAIISGIWLFLGIIGTFSIFLMGRGVTRPIVKLTETTRSIANTGSLKKTAMTQRHDEVGQLSQAFDGMIDRLQSTEERLTGSEKKYRSLFETANDAIFLLDETGIIDCNCKSGEMFGTNCQTLLGKSPYQLSPETQPDERSSKEKADERIKESMLGTPQFFEWKHKKFDGTLFDAEVSLNRVEIDGRAALLAIIRDISERKKAEQMLAQSEQKFRTMVENSQAGIFLVDGSFHITYTNTRLGEILGYTIQEIEGSDFRRFLDEESKALIADRYVRRQRGEQLPSRYEFNIIRKDGEKRRAELSSAVVHNADGTTVTVGQVLDVTEERKAHDELRKTRDEMENRVIERTAELRDANTLLQNEIAQRVQAEAALQQSEIKYRHLVQGANTIILEMDPLGRVTFFNKFAEEFFGFSESEIISKSVVGTIVPSIDSAGRDLEAMIKDIVKNPKLYLHNENENMKRNGDRAWIVWTNQPLFDADGNLKEVLCFGIDRTEQKRSEEMLARQSREKAAAEERSRLARDLHDAVSQTLFSASLIADVLPRLWERSQNEGRKRLEEVRQLTRGALAEMRTLLLELRPSALVEAELGYLLHQLGESITGRSRVPVSVNVSGECSLPTEAKVALYRIAQESLNNVAKHSGASGAKVNLCCEADKVTLKVSDNGRGFDKASIQPDSLGLGIMRERAHSIGASLSVTSAIGKGTEVTLVWELHSKRSKI